MEWITTQWYFFFKCFYKKPQNVSITQKDIPRIFNIFPTEIFKKNQSTLQLRRAASMGKNATHGSNVDPQMWIHPLDASNVWRLNYLALTIYIITTIIIIQLSLHSMWLAANCGKIMATTQLLELIKTGT